MGINIIQRLKRLEQCSPDRLVILANIDGVEKKCSVDELKANPQAVFIRVLNGNSTSDVDEILEWVGVLSDNT